MRKLLAVAATLCLAAAGCVDHTTLIILDRDGSGQIAETTYMAFDPMSMMGGDSGGGGNEKADISMPAPDAKKLQAKAATLGEGVSFVSVTPVSKPDGTKGHRVLYSFNDINKLKVKMGDAGSNGPEMGGGPAMAGPMDDSGPVTFQYADGRLTIRLPRSNAEPKPMPQEQPAVSEEQPDYSLPDGEADDADDQMMAGMMQMFKGMRIRLVVKTPDEIKATNARYVMPHPKTGVKQFVNLIDFNMDKLLAGNTKLLMEMQSRTDPAKTLEMLAEAGMFIETNETININF